MADPLEGLNWITPHPSLHTSPANGTADPNRNQWDLSLPVDANQVAAQLDAWTNVAFDYESFVGVAPPAFDRAFSAKAGSSAEGAANLLSPFSSGSTTGIDGLPVSTVSPDLTVLPTSLASSAAIVPSIDTSAPGQSIGNSDAHTSGVGTLGMTEDQLDEEANRRAIDEDKRRRNTAASARFRVKKKQREQALEQSAKDLRERVVTLEREVESLKSENGWLRTLVLERGGSVKREEAQQETPRSSLGKRQKADKSA